MHYLFLTLAVVAEVVGTAALKSSGELTKLVPSIITVVAFLASFLLMALSLRAIPMGVAYAMWSGLGILMVSAVGWIMHQEALNPPTLVGLGLIASGCITINLFSGAELT